VLVPKLLDRGYSVVVYDLMLFGSDGLAPHPNLEVVRGDLRDTPAFATAVKGADSVIHRPASRTIRALNWIRA
jgi:nucleoside-diphosphate-sugar epimerase